MSELPNEDVEFHIMRYSVFQQIIADSAGKRTSGQCGPEWTTGITSSSPRRTTSYDQVWRLPSAGQLLTPFKRIDDADEWTKKHTDDDILGWKDAIYRTGKLIRQVKIFGFSGDAYLKTHKGQDYVILKGRPGIRDAFKGTRYLKENEEIKRLDMVIGAKDYVMEGLKGVKVAIFITIPLDIVKELLQDRPSWSDLGASIVGDIGGIIVFEGVVATIGLITAPFSVPVVAVGVVSFAFGIAALHAYNDLTERLKLNEKMKEFLEQHSNQIEMFVTSIPGRSWRTAVDISKEIISHDEENLSWLYRSGRSFLVGRRP